MSHNQSTLTWLRDNTYVCLVARVLAGGAFIVLGCLKMADPVVFLKNVHEYGLVPDSLPLALNWIAAILPMVEIICGLGLVLGIARRGGALLIAAMLLAFYPPLIMRSLAIMQETGLPYCSVSFDCGCGTGPVYICNKLAENTLLLFLALFTLWSRSDGLSVWPGHKRNENTSIEETEEAAVSSA